jgi:hypothetical protein
MSTPTVEPAAPVELGARGRATGAIVWSAFLAASVATMLCFAFLDPHSLATGEPPAWWSSRLRVYAIGFFFFWLVGLVAATLCWQLACPAGSTGSR